MAHAALLSRRARAVSQSALRLTRSGFSLLEVLVACGILVFALAGIAAILPAAGSIVADGVAHDRAGLLAANVMAELRSRDLFRATLYTGGTSVVLGNLGSPLTWTTGTADVRFKGVEAFLYAPLISSPSIRPAASVIYGAWPYDSKIAENDYRGFYLEDDLQMDLSGTAPAFAYEFGNAAMGTALGPRAFNRKTSWAAIITPIGTAPQPGDIATLSIATFTKVGDVAPITLTSSTAVGMYSLPAGQEAVVKTFLRPGSYFLAIAGTTTPRPPAWLQVQSSWTVQSGTASQRLSYVMVNDRNSDPSLYEQTTSGTKQVFAIGFAGLLRLDQFPVVLK